MTVIDLPYKPPCLIDLIQKGGKWISWKHIESLYLRETSTFAPGVRLCRYIARKFVIILQPFRHFLKILIQVHAMHATLCLYVPRNIMILFQFQLTSRPS